MRQSGGGEADVPNVSKLGIFYGALEKPCDVKPSAPRKRPKFIFNSKTKRRWSVGGAKIGVSFYVSPFVTECH